LFKKYLHEPLFHFLLLGALLFAFYSWSNKDTLDDTESTIDTIIVTEEEVDQLSNQWEKSHLRLPTAKEKQELLDKTIYTKVMYKEALKMGLDKNDPVIRGRLIQKMEFLSADMAQLIEPTDEELIAYMHQHADDFTRSTKNGELPALKDVRITLYNRWMDAQRKETNKLFYDNFKKGYKIEIEKSPK
jgi:hypothetical protein